MDYDFQWSLGVQNYLSPMLKTIQSDSEQFGRKITDSWSSLQRHIQRVNPFAALSVKDASGRLRDPMSGQFTKESGRKYQVWFATLEKGFSRLTQHTKKLNTGRALEKMMVPPKGSLPRSRPLRGLANLGAGLTFAAQESGFSELGDYGGMQNRSRGFGGGRSRGFGGGRGRGRGGSRYEDGWFDDEGEFHEFSKMRKAFNLMKKHVSENISSVEELGFSWRQVGYAVSGITATGLIIKMIVSANDYANATRKLNTEITMTASRTKMANQMLAEQVGILGADRAEIGGILEQAANFGLLNDATAKGMKSLRSFTHETLVLSKATGESADRIGDYNFRVAQLYGIGWDKLRNFGSAFKYLKDQTRLTNNELIGLTDKADSLMSVLPQGERAKSLMGLQAIGGALKDAGLASDDFMATFEDMSKEVRKFGHSQLIGIFGQMGASVSEMTEGIEKGDFVSVFEQMQKAIKGLDPKQISMMTDMWKDQGLAINETQMRWMQAMEPGQFRTLVAGMEAEAKKATLAKTAADQTRDLLFGPWEAFSLKIKNFFGRPGGFGEALLTRVHTLSTKITGALTTFMKTLTGSKLADATNALDGVFDALTVFFLKDIPRYWLEMQPYIQKFKDWIDREGGVVALLKKVIDWGGKVGTALLAVGGAVYGFVETMVPPLSKIFDVLSTAFEGLKVGFAWVPDVKEWGDFGVALAVVALVLGKGHTLSGGIALIGAMGSWNATLAGAGGMTAQVKLLTGGLGGLQAVLAGTGGLVALFMLGAAAIALLAWSLAELDKRQKEIAANDSAIAANMQWKGEKKDYEQLVEGTGWNPFGTEGKGLRGRSEDMMQAEAEIKRIKSTFIGGADTREAKSAIADQMAKIKKLQEVNSSEAFNAARRIMNPEQRAAFLQTWVGRDWSKDPRAIRAFEDAPELIHEGVPRLTSGGGNIGPTAPLVTETKTPVLPSKAAKAGAVGRGGLSEVHDPEGADLARESVDLQTRMAAALDTLTKNTSGLAEQTTGAFQRSGGTIQNLTDALVSHVGG